MLISARLRAYVCESSARMLLSSRASRVCSFPRELRPHARVCGTSARMLVSSRLRAYARVCSSSARMLVYAKLRAHASLCEAPRITPPLSCSARMLVSAGPARVCSPLRELRAYARVCAGFARMLVSAEAPRVCSSLRDLRAYALVCAGSAQAPRTYARCCAAPRVCSFLRRLRAGSARMHVSARPSAYARFSAGSATCSPSYAHALL